MKRGDLYLASVHPRTGAEMRGDRPVLIVSHDSFNQTTSWQSLVVVPLSTSPRQARRGPTAVPIPDGIGGLRGDGIAVCHQITTLDRSKIVRRLGSLPPEVMQRVDAGIRAAIDLR